MLLADVQKILDHASVLPDNWDSYGGRAVSPETLDMARWLLGLICHVLPSTTQIVNTSGGGIGVEWQQSEIDYSLEIAGPANFTLTRLSERYKIDEEVSISNDNRDRVIALLQWLMV